MEGLGELVITGAIIFLATMGISYMMGERRRDTNHLEDQVVRMRIQTDMLAATRGSRRAVRSDNIVLEIVRMVSTEPKTVREIQAGLGRSREHVARVVTKMYRDGYLERVDERPFRYGVADAGMRLLDD